MDRGARTHRLNGTGDEPRAISRIVFMCDRARAHPRDDLDLAMSMQAETRMRREFIVVPYVKRAKRRMAGAPGLTKAKMQPCGEPVAPDCAEREKRTMFDQDDTPFERVRRECDHG